MPGVCPSPPCGVFGSCSGFVSTAAQSMPATQGAPLAPPAWQGFERPASGLGSAWTAARALMAAPPRSAVQAAVWIDAAKQIGPIAAAVRPVPLAVRTIARSAVSSMPSTAVCKSIVPNVRRRPSVKKIGPKAGPGIVETQARSSGGRNVRPLPLPGSVPFAAKPLSRTANL